MTDTIIGLSRLQRRGFVPPALPSDSQDGFFAFSASRVIGYYLTAEIQSDPRNLNQLIYGTNYSNNTE